MVLLKIRFENYSDSVTVETIRAQYFWIVKSNSNRPSETATEFRMQVTCKSSTNGFRAHGLKPRGRFRVLQTWISSLRVILAAVVYQSGLNNGKSEQFAKKGIEVLSRDRRKAVFFSIVTEKSYLGVKNVIKTLEDRNHQIV